MTTNTHYDAHKSASADEMTFTLQGGDPYCAPIIELWAVLMDGSLPHIEQCFDRLRTALNEQNLLGNSFGIVQMEKGKHTKAYKYAMDIRGGTPVQSGEAKTYDAHSSAKKGELTFTLQSGDPYCADIAELWAALITGNENETELRFQQITKTYIGELQGGNPFGQKQLQKGKITMAYELIKEIKIQKHTADIVQ